VLTPKIPIWLATMHLPFIKSHTSNREFTPVGSTTRRDNMFNHHCYLPLLLMIFLNSRHFFKPCSSLVSHSGGSGSLTSHCLPQYEQCIWSLYCLRLLCLTSYIILQLLKNHTFTVNALAGRALWNLRANIKA
jgi:hypothetical protein